jgi:MOSC domain-containing protein YiiM
MEHCESCGFVWELVAAAELASRLADIGPSYRRLMLPPDRPSDWTTRAATRPAPEVWSAVEYACHVRDVLLTNRERLFTTLVLDEPAFTPMFRDERVQLAGYASEDLIDVVVQIELSSAMLARAVARLDRSQLARTCHYGYPAPAVRSLTWVGAQTVHEAEHHLADIAAQLAPFDGGLEHVRRSPQGVGTIEMIVARPAIDERVELDEGRLTAAAGLEGDNWTERPSARTPDRSPLVAAQLTLMNSRAAQLVAGDRARWELAGDQIFVDLDLSEAALPSGTRLALGTAVIEVSAEPHRGCAKFTQRFGLDALRAVNSAVGRELRLRGLNARVITDGVVRPGDKIAVVDDG